MFHVSDIKLNCMMCRHWYRFWCSWDRRW